MPTFSWDVSDNKPSDGFSANGKQMQVTSESRSKFPVSVSINGEKKDTVFPGQNRSFRLPSGNTLVEITKVNGNGFKGTAEGTALVN